MSWDGIYRTKTHARISDGPIVVACKRKLVRRCHTTDKHDIRRVTCFACLKALGLIK